MTSGDDAEDQRQRAVVVVATGARPGRRLGLAGVVARRPGRGLRTLAAGVLRGADAVTASPPRGFESGAPIQRTISPSS